jgi:hypothetical protein
MTFEKFKQITDQMVQNSTRIDKSYEQGVDLMEFTEGYHSVIGFLWGEILTVDGLDWFNWFMYEKNYLQDGKGNPEMQAYSKINDGEQVEIVQDLEGLYEYLKENNYFKCESQK